MVIGRADGRPPLRNYFIPFRISSARSMRTTFSMTICAATFSINSPLAPAAMATTARRKGLERPWGGGLC